MAFGRWAARMLALVFFTGLILTQSASAQKTVSGAGITFDVTDYSPTGFNAGTEGFWFANFNRTAPVTGEPVDSNHVNNLPSWILPDFDPNMDYSFGGMVTSSGGNPAWNSLTLPDGATGLSGSLVDPETDNNPNNTIQQLLLGPGVPASFIMHVVVDNTNGMHDPADRIRGRAESADGLFDEDFRYITTPTDFNGIADIYSFRYDDWEPGDFLKMQLNSGVPGIDAGFAGLMFDIVPEPASLSLMLVGVLAAAGFIRRH